jgi:hypothetical protein
MARISEQVLAGLARPTMAQGMFDLGAAIGGVPGQMKQKRRQDEFNEIMKMGQAAMANNDPVNLSRVSQQLAALGYTKESQQFAQAAQQANVRMQQIEGSQGLMAAITGEEGFTPEVEQSLINSGVTPAQIVAGREERRSQEARQREKDALGSLSSAALQKAAKNKDPVSSEAYVRSLIDTQDVKGLREFLSKQKDVRGTRAAPQIRSIYSEEKGYNEDIAVFRNDEGDIETETIGRSEVEPSEPRDTGLQTVTGMKIVDRATGDAREAARKTAELRDIVQQAERLADIPLGGVAGGAREFLVKNVAGLADEYSFLRSRLNKQQMGAALELLPRGPASDRDVALALSASPNLNDYNPEDRIRILRGFVKLQEAQERYLRERKTYMVRTKDPLAMGYEEYTRAIGAEEQRIAYEQDYSVQVNQIKEMLRALPEDDMAAAQALQVIRSVEKDMVNKKQLPASYLEMLEAEKSAIELWEEVKNTNEITISLP